MTDAVAPDGSPVLLYLAIGGEEEAVLVHGAVPGTVAILELGCGAGRVSRPLAALGHAVTGVDNSPEMLSHLDGVERIETVLADITTLDLTPRRWPVVLMASHLVNDDLGPTFLAAAARHVTADGCVLVERHAPGWVDSVEPSARERDGIAMSIGAIARPRPGSMQATMVYELEGRRFEQSFTAHDVDDERLESMAAAVGLTVNAVLDPSATWIRLRRTAR